MYEGMSFGRTEIGSSENQTPGEPRWGNASLLQPHAATPDATFVWSPLRVEPERLPYAIIAAICVGGVIPTSAFGQNHALA